MATVNVHEAKTHLSRLIAEVEAGGEVVIARSNRPIVKLVLVAEALPPRKLGTAAGKVRITEDFAEPLEDFDGYQ